MDLGKDQTLGKGKFMANKTRKQELKTGDNKKTSWIDEAITTTNMSTTVSDTGRTGRCIQWKYAPQNGRSQPSHLRGGRCLLHGIIPRASHAIEVTSLASGLSGINSLH